MENKLVESFKGLKDGRIVCWFSHGIASTVAAKLTIDAMVGSGSHREIVIADIFLKEECSDNVRFYEQVKPVLLENVPEELLHLVTFETLVNEKYSGSVDNVIYKTRYMSGVYGAQCTKSLKKDVRYSWQKPDDIHVFGMTSEESHRIDNLVDNENELNVWSPLIEAGLTKEDCFEVFSKSGVEVPLMYRLGFNNNNCVGCVKAGGAGYWNHTRKLFPDVFEIRSKQEETLGVSLVKMTLNTLINKHTTDVIKLLSDLSDGVIKEIKVDGANSPTIVSGKFKHCTLVNSNFIVGDIVAAGTVKGIGYDTVAVNSYELFNKHTEQLIAFLEWVVENGVKIKSYNSSIRVPLRYLPEDAGDQKSMYVGDCGFFCEKGENDN